MIYVCVPINNSFQMDKYYRCIIEEFLAYDHIDYFHLDSPASLGWAGIERGELCKRIEGERDGTPAKEQVD